MAWVVILGWINTSFLGVLGLAVLMTRRWRHLKWLPVYIFIVFFLSVVQLLGLYIHEFSFPKRLICCLLHLGAVAEVLRKDAVKSPHWLWFALFGLTVIPFLPIGQEMIYFLPQFFFYAGLSLELPTALRLKSTPLLGWSVFGAATIVSNLIKIIKPIDEVEKLLAFLDPCIFTVMVGIMFTSLFWPEVERWILPSLRKIKPLLNRNVFERASERSEEKIADAQKSAPAVEQTKSRIKLRVGIEEPGKVVKSPHERAIEELETRLGMLEEVVKAAIQSDVKKIRKMFLSPVDVAIYLGTNEEMAKRFVEHHKIPKLQLSEDPDDWLVFRADVDDNIEEPE